MRRGVLAVFGALLVVAGGFGSVRLLQRHVGVSENVALILLLAFVLAAGVLSGRIRELSTPGGWGAKFAEQAKAPVDPSQAPIDLSTAEMEEIPKQTVAEIAERIGLVRDGRPLVLTLTVGKGDYYRLHAVAWALQALAQFRNFKLVVFRDLEGRLVAYAPSWLLRAALERGGSAAEGLIAAVNGGQRNDVVSFPGMLTDCVTTVSTNAEALASMERSNLEAVVVVDRDTREVRGVIERDRVLARMMLALAAGNVRAAQEPRAA